MPEVSADRVGCWHFRVAFSVDEIPSIHSTQGRGAATAVFISQTLATINMERRLGIELGSQDDSSAISKQRSLAERERLFITRTQIESERIAILSLSRLPPAPLILFCFFASKRSLQLSWDQLALHRRFNRPHRSNFECSEMDHDETGCQVPPEGPILCINNCGFFGSVATMNMCSKCYKDAIFKQEQAKLAASSIENIVNGSSSSNGKEPIVAGSVDMQVDPVEAKVIATEACASGLRESGEVKVKQGPNRCSTCKKRVGLTGFYCRCGELFCAVHRYSDKHNCPFDYQTAARDAIAKANPLVRAEKLDKI
ncbi:hypothetical protein Nepgr_014799 [Nepenthes gracilis]|uniref:Zinc finger A20 and AN1 domain-containing stress-associated protein 8 n=1 Tax=Nepenthes gracilis TaxID=150966 RepID=A0AAD3XQ66_NEPGR|nr:hypothetical protein Nepgr_014799 [Nepenthes gracilis]